MTILIVGTGNIGRRHYENLRRSSPTTRVLVKSRPTSSMPNWLSAADRITELDPSELDGFSGAIIASPAPLHHISASPLLKARVPVLVEKPLADVPVNADTIIDASVRMNTPLMVGYTLRWYEPLQQLKSLVKAGTVGTPVHLSASVGSHLATWRPNMDYRSTVSAQRKLGGGALLELSHEIDYCLWLLGRPESVAALVRRSGVIEGDVEDMVDLQLSFADGIAASIHLDLIDRHPHRRCRVVGTEGTLELNFLTHELWVTCSSGTRCATFPNLGLNDMYLRQQKRFLAMVDGTVGGTEPAADEAVMTARSVLDVVDTARRASITGGTESL